MKITALLEQHKDKVFTNFDEWKEMMKSRGCDRLEQEDELTKIHVYALTPEGRVMGVWHHPQKEKMGVCYNEKNGREFSKTGRKFKHLEKL